MLSATQKSTIMNMNPAPDLEAHSDCHKNTWEDQVHLHLTAKHVSSERPCLFPVIPAQLALLNPLLFWCVHKINCDTTVSNETIFAIWFDHELFLIAVNDPVKDIVYKEKAKGEVHHIRVNFFGGADRSHTRHACCDCDSHVEDVHDQKVRFRLFAQHTAVRLVGKVA